MNGEALDEAKNLCDLLNFKLVINNKLYPVQITE